MSDGIESYIRGAFHGYRLGAIFKLANGKAWQQNDNLYQYQYAYQPEARVYAEGDRQMILVARMDDPVEVTRARIIAEGQIVSDFKGFDQDMQFEFSNGQIWEQAEYKYNYHYAYRPNAILVQGRNGEELQVDGMNEAVRVRRVK